MEKNEQIYCSEDTFIPIDMFPEGQKAINRTLPIWNFAETDFYKENNVYIFIIYSLSQCGFDNKILNKYIDYFGKDTILDAFEYYKDRVGDDFRDLIKTEILKIIK